MVSALLVAAIFFVAIVASIVLMSYVTWRGSKASDFFGDAVKELYELPVPEAEICAYYDLKEKLRKQYAPDTLEDDCEDVRWITKLPAEVRADLQRALVRRLVASLDNLETVQRDKPGNWKLWREKLVSERYWLSLCETEKFVSEEIDGCVAEADQLEPGWKQHIFRQAVQCWRMQKQQVFEKKVQKKAVVNEKKVKEKEERQVEQEKKRQVEDKERQERQAEKMMEKLLREEEMAAGSKQKAGSKAKAKPASKKK